MIFRLIAAIAQVWSWIGFGYYWHASSVLGMTISAIAAVSISLIAAFVEVFSEQS
jgi:hypothetical protein